MNYHNSYLISSVSIDKPKKKKQPEFKTIRINWCGLWLVNENKWGNVKLEKLNKQYQYNKILYTDEYLRSRMKDGGFRKKYGDTVKRLHFFQFFRKCSQVRNISSIFIVNKVDSLPLVYFPVQHSEIGKFD